MQHLGAFAIWLGANLIFIMISMIMYFNLGDQRYKIKKFISRSIILTIMLTLFIWFLIAKGAQG